MNNNNHSFLSSSSSSDDEFLTSPDIGGAINGEDGREALVRKKLLESFYGGASHTISIGDDCVVNDSIVVDSVKMEANQFDNYDKVLSLSATKQASFTTTTTTQITLPFNATKSDLDSPIFTPKTYTLSHIVHSPLETLLITNEYLALDIRTLDSTMQTLVYENYSKFINATDAIKCIGVNVSSISGGEQMMTTTSNEQEPNIKGEGNTAHENHGLQRLLKGINNIQLTSTKSERLLHESREAVAEKLRIQRLLVRLDALLSLPTTLRTYISQGKYRLAVQSHGSATEILGRHSDKGFESLKSIEVECGVILNELVIGLKSKLIYWSGGGDRSSSSYDKNNLLKGLIGDNRTAGSSTYSTSMSRPPPPKSIAEIFECAGTILMLYPSFTPGFDKYQCQTLALAACGQYLRELLTGDTSLTSSGSPRGRKKRGAALTCTDTESKGAVLELPMSFLDGILEATTLYGVSFPSSTPTDKTDTGQDSLQKFVTSNFDKFISHVHMLLIQQSDGSSNTKLQGTSSGDDDDGEESNDNVNFHQVSIALGHLIRSIRELASGLALPEVGLDVLLASTLVDQTMELAEMLVRRLVSRKFHQLRSVVVTECLAPLVMEVSKAGDVFVKQDGVTSSTLGGMVQLANVALSDGLQMADDLIRDTLQYSQANLITTPVNTEVMKLAVQREAKLFGFWLASTLEQLVGYRNDGSLLEVHDHREEGENDWQQQTKKKKIIPQLKIEEVGDCQHWTTAPFYYTHSSADSFKEGDTSNLVMNLLVQLDDGLSDRAYTNFLLAICEMCRLAERSIANTLNQSIQSAMEEDARVADSANTLFGNSINPNRKGKEGLDSEQILSKRFQLAASRALAMYTMNRGAHAASEIFTDMYCLSDARDPYAIPHKPRSGCLKVFDIVKASCEDCITIVGGDLFVLPLPPFPDEIEYTNVFGDRLTESRGNGGGGGTSSGLQLDVERMFIEKSQVYPHSLDRIEFTRNSVTSGILRVALAAFMECVRSSVVSSLGYRQLKVDAIFLRYIIPHYVNDEFGTDDANACSSLLNIIDDVMLKAEQRCLDHEVTSDDDYYDVKKDEIYTPFQIVQRYCNADKVVKKVSF